MKTVWWLNQYAQNLEGPGGTRHFSIARCLPEHGWQAWIIAGSLELNTNRQRLPEGAGYSLREYEGVPFLWLRTPTFKTGPQRVVNMAHYTLRALLPRYTRDLPRPDVVVGSTVHPFAALAGSILARRFRVPFVFEVRDLWPETFIQMGVLDRDHPGAKALRGLEKFLYRRAAKIVISMPHAWRYIERFGIPRQRIVWISNGVDTSLYDPAPPDAHDGPLELYYIGGMATTHNVGMIL